MLLKEIMGTLPVLACRRMIAIEDGGLKQLDLGLKPDHGGCGRDAVGGYYLRAWIVHITTVPPGESGSTS